MTGDRQVHVLRIMHDGSGTIITRIEVAGCLGTACDYCAKSSPRFTDLITLVTHPGKRLYPQPTEGAPV